MKAITTHESRAAVDARVQALFAQMTLAEKIGQMAQIEKNSVTPEQVRDHAVGSVLSGGGGNPSPNTPADWARMVRDFQEAALQSRLGIPIWYGTDAVHGHNNVRGATIFPHNIGLGAARDADLVRRIAQVTAREMLATHANWAFAPEVSVPQDIRWGRTFEGFSEDTALVSELGVAVIEGLQQAAAPDQRVLASVKHFVADGGTTWGTTRSYDWIPGWWQSADPQRWRIDQGDSRIDEATLRAVHLPPYAAAIAAGARNIMVSYSSWNGLKLHAHRYLLTDVLKGEMGFDGFLVSDWLAAQQLDADLETGMVTAINAGLDMIMVPFRLTEFITAVTRAVSDSRIALSRIDDAVTRILRVKVEFGLFERPFGDETLLATVGCDEHRQIAREAVRKSLVLLKGEPPVLPLARTASRLLIAGAGADNMGRQCGGWTIEWQGKEGDITPGTTLLQAVQQTASASTEVLYDADGAFADDVQAESALVVLSEVPYAEGEGDRQHLALPPEDVALVQRMRARCDRLIVVLYSGRPLVVDSILDQCDALVAAWLPGTEAAGITDVLFGDYPFHGMLPYAWPRGESAQA
ncbi:MAG TPA: glycoside hydrolase family 3 protein [Aggregatilineales bacterium]|nr:glycoside hydrolase family 3 protein [Aggregatilineales bacterium]